MRFARRFGQTSGMNIGWGNGAGESHRLLKPWSPKSQHARCYRSYVRFGMIECRLRPARPRNLSILGRRRRTAPVGERCRNDPQLILSGVVLDSPKSTPELSYP